VATGDGDARGGGGAAATTTEGLRPDEAQPAAHEGWAPPSEMLLD
jgi:hypothetical protein